MVPAIRIRSCNDAPILAHSQYVLYWMIANRRLSYNFSLDRALDHCRDLRKPLVILEALRIGYQWASDRLHRFVIDGMADNAAGAARHPILYYPYVEPIAGAGKGLLDAIAADACVVVTDDFPCFFLPRMISAAAKKLTVLLEAVDSNGLLPLRAADHAFLRAFDFRRHLQKVLPGHLTNTPASDPFSAISLRKPPRLPEIIRTRWPSAAKELLHGKVGSLDALPIDHSVKPVEMRGGHSAATARLKGFLKTKFSLYSEERNEPELCTTSNVSPYLHFGHISAHEIFAEVARREKWRPRKLSLRSNGAREGWWNMSRSAENFLDQLITWRELGYNFCAHREDYDRYESLPPWALKTLDEHATDERPACYSLKEFVTATTHDPLWNAAQGELLKEGHIHNYLRMLWGKKILQWSASPQAAASILIELNNKYGLDGRNPNSYSGIFWCLGRYDRPWGPVRPIFGKVRYMSSENTARKLRVKNYINKYSQPTGPPEPGLG
ncbi:MAG: deoxyribodipyrimidine photolyase [Acidobacteriota bacterium]|nr:deoxyribodipyrimidine photolyase [Acidobacteriota bacterium]